jgi:hypothetical protein
MNDDWEDCRSTSLREWAFNLGSISRASPLCSSSGRQIFFSTDRGTTRRSTYSSCAGFLLRRSLISHTCLEDSLARTLLFSTPAAYSLTEVPT